MQDGGHFSLKMSENKENSIASSLFCFEFVFCAPQFNIRQIEFVLAEFPILNQVKNQNIYFFATLARSCPNKC